MACLISSLDSWALGTYPPCPASQQILHVCNYLGDSLPQAVMHIVRVILGGTWTNVPYFICHILF